eukprot:83168-Pelagomonas_calceolata.AAC.3
MVWVWGTIPHRIKALRYGQKRHANQAAQLGTACHIGIKHLGMVRSDKPTQLSRIHLRASAACIHHLEYKTTLPLGQIPDSVPMVTLPKPLATQDYGPKEAKYERVRPRNAYQPNPEPFDGKQLGHTNCQPAVPSGLPTFILLGLVDKMLAKPVFCSARPPQPGKKTTQARSGCVHLGKAS